MNPFHPIQQVAVVAGAVVVVLGWQLWMERTADQATTTQVIALLAEWNTTPDLAQRTRLQEQIEARMKNLANPATLVRQLTPRDWNSFAANEALQAWWDRDEPSLLSWLGSLENPPPYQTAHFLGELMKQPQVMQGYLATIPPSRWQNIVIATAARDDIHHGKPQAALSLIEPLPPGPLRSELQTAAAFEWAQDDFPEATRWVQQLPDSTTRETLAQAVALARAQEHPCEAVEWLQRANLPRAMMTIAVRAVMDRWAQEHDPQEATKWIAHLPPGPAREDAASWMAAQPLSTPRTR
ncbi:MAG: hypothetical protein QM796_22790 [Chthoniobacteraceae bacterium]